MNILFCSVGRRGKLLSDFRNSLKGRGKVVATDMSNTAPALYFADKYYLVPPIYADDYIDTLLGICKKESINAITTLIDPEIMLLAKHRDLFNEINVEVLCPEIDTAEICYDKYLMFNHLKSNKITTVLTFADLNEFNNAYENGDIEFPVFVKPKSGSGSVGARVVIDYNDLENLMLKDEDLIIQEYMKGAIDIDVDIYFDTISREPVSIFSKKKLETRIGGANKTVSFFDQNLVDFVIESSRVFSFNGPIDMDLWLIDGKYYLSEINPRFGGAYIHAYACGLNFMKLIENNINGIMNVPKFNNYDEDIVMMMYDDAIFTRLKNS